MSNTIGFDESFYLSQNPDVAAAVSRGIFTSGAQHFQLNGRFEGRNPNAFFNTSFYLGQYPDVAKAGINPLTHFLTSGAAEGRFANATEKAAIDLNNNGGADDFNEAAYRAQYSDVDAAIKAGTFKNAYQHFVQFGQFEGRTATLANGATITGPFSNTGTVPGAGSSLVLTTGVDNIVGTAGNDTINAFVAATTAAGTSTLTAADSINGGTGVDTLNLTVDGNGAGSLPGANITNVEIFNIREVGGTAGAYDFATVAGEQQVWADRSTDTVSFTGVGTSTTAGSAATIGVRGNGTTALGDVTFRLATASDKISVAFDNVGTSTGTSVVALGTNSATSATILSTGGANSVGTIDFSTGAGPLTDLTVNATTNLSVNLSANDYVAAGANLVVSGAATSVNLGNNGVFKTIDASGLTAGGLTVGLNAVTTSFKGGAGNDVVTTAQLGTGAAASSIDAGAGTADRLVVGATAHVDEAAEAARFAGFEVLDVGTQTADVSLFTNSAFNALRIGGAGAVNNITAAQALNITQYASGSATIGVAGAATNGQIDTVKIMADDGLTAVNTIALGTPVLTGVENLQLVATDNLSITALTSATSLTSVTASGAGTINIATGGLAIAANASINAASATGAFTFSGASATGNGLSITGSSTAANNITGTDQADIIVGGTGVDTVVATAGVDTVNFAVDNAKDVFDLAVLTGRTTITNFDAATSTTSEDILNVSADAVDGAEVVITAAAGQAALGTDRTIVIEQSVGAGGSLTTGGTATLTTADFTATTLTNVAAFLTERFTTSANDQALIVLNNGTNSYAYHINEGAADAGIQAAEVTLVGVFNNAVLLNGDIIQTV